MSADLIIALGAMEFGTRIDEATSFALLDQYVDGGGVWIDTADCYAFWLSDSGAGGDSEALIGRWLAQRPGMRERVKIATKAGCEPVEAGASRRRPPACRTVRHRHPVRGVAATARPRAASTCSSPTATTVRSRPRRSPRPWAGTPPRAGSGGSGCRTGRSGAPSERAPTPRARACPAADTLQLRYSYLQPRPMVRNRIHDHRMGWITDETLDYLEANPQWEAWAYSPLMQGSYDRDDREPEEAFDHLGSDRRKEVLAEVAGDLGVSAQRRGARVDGRRQPRDPPDRRHQPASPARRGARRRPADPDRRPARGPRRRLVSPAARRRPIRAAARYEILRLSHP